MISDLRAVYASGKPGTQKQNMAECAERGRKIPTAARGERNGNYKHGKRTKEQRR